MKNILFRFNDEMKRIILSPSFYIFIICILLCIWLDGDVLRYRETPALYTIILIFAGYVFARSFIFQIIASGVITYIKYLFVMTSQKTILEFMITFFAYLLTVCIVGMAIKYYKGEKESILNLVYALAKSLDSRDPYTASHSENVANYALIIAKEMKLSTKQQNNIYIGGILHDIGKIGIPEDILKKPGKLTSLEYKTIQSHPSIGYDLVKHIPSFKKNGILDMILYHHERVDGKGYPQGLKGNQIPLVAKIMAVADSFDAMTSKRVYRGDNDIEFAINEIKKNKGIQFDEQIADIFLQVLEREKKEEKSIEAS